MHQIFIITCLVPNVKGNPMQNQHSLRGTYYQGRLRYMRYIIHRGRRRRTYYPRVCTKPNTRTSTECTIYMNFYSTGTYGAIHGMVNSKIIYM